MNDEEVDEYLSSHGTSISVVRKELDNHDLYKDTFNKKTGRTERRYRRQISLSSNMKPFIHFPRCYTTVKVALTHEGFTWDTFAAGVFSLSGADLALSTNAAESIKQIFTVLEPIMDKLLDDKKSEFIQSGDRLASETEDREGEEESAPTTAENACVTTEDTFGKHGRKRKRDKKRPGVAKVFKEDILMGLGMKEDAVRQHYAQHSQELGEEEQQQQLSARVAEIAKDIGNRNSTFVQYVTVQNLFLLHAHSQHPEMWTDSGLILATETTCHQFLESCLRGDNCLTGDEPALRDVLLERESFVPTKASQRFKDGNGNKFVNALSDVRSKQRMILGFPNVPRLRDFGLINTWLCNLCNSEADLKEKAFEDRHAGTFPFDDPFATARAQSTHLLQQDSWQSSRLRCLMLTQLWSISRWNEMAEWKVCDLALTTYTTEGYTALKQPMVPLYILQTKYKGSKQKRKMKPQKRLLVRRRDVGLCPQSSLAMFLFERFVLECEEDIDVLSPNDAWYPIKIFRTRLDRKRVPASSAIREERIQVGKDTETGISGLVNHYGRQLGSFIGKACGLTDEEVKEIGLWDTDTRSAHYFTGHDPSMVARLSGYPSLEAFSMPRAMASPKTFASSHPQFENIYNSFMPFTDSDTVKESAARARAKDSRTPAMVLKALSVLKDVFFQDLPYYHSRWPDLRMWQCASFVQHRQALEEWIDYVKSFEELEQPTDAPQAGIGLDAVEIRLIREDMRAQNARLDRLATQLESGMGGMAKTMITAGERTPNQSCLDTLYVKTLRAMNDMSLDDVVNEWCVTVTIEGLTFAGGIKKLMTDKKVKFDPRLRSQLRRMKLLGEKAIETTTQLGSLERAVTALEELRTEGEKRIALWQLAEKFSAEKSKK